MIRQLTIADFDAAVAVVDDNPRFANGLPMADFRDKIVAGLKARLTIDPGAVLLGGFDSAGLLTRWTAFKVWDKAEELDAYTWNMQYGYFHQPAYPLVDLMNAACAQFQGDGLYHMYMNHLPRPLTFDAVPFLEQITAPDCLYSTYDITKVCDVYPNAVARHALINKYVVSQPVPFLREVVRLSKRG